jgi:hypothetical protein
MFEPLTTTGPPANPVPYRSERDLPRTEHSAGAAADVPPPSRVLNSAVAAGGTTQQGAQHESKEQQQWADQARSPAPMPGDTGKLVDQVA